MEHDPSVATATKMKKAQNTGSSSDAIRKGSRAPFTRIDSQQYDLFQNSSFYGRCP